MSVSRGFHTGITIIILLLFATACGSTASVRPTGTSSLALQSDAPVWGGDAQPATTDVVRRAITVQQAKEIAKACSDAPAELPNSGADTCEKKIQRAIPALYSPCTIRDLCIEVVRVPKGQVAQPDGFIQIVDMRPGKPLCSSRPDGLCFRVGVQDQVLQRVTSLAPSVATPTSTACPTPTDTTNPTPTDTNCPTPTDTTSPTPTDTTSPTPTDATSPTPTDTTSPTPTDTTSLTPKVAPASSPAHGSNS
jgi:hypothetical protein